MESKQFRERKSDFKFFEAVTCLYMLALEDKPEKKNIIPAKDFVRSQLSSPVDYQVVIRGFLIADGTSPGGFLLIHLEIERCVEALEVGAGDGSAGHDQPHLTQLGDKKEEVKVVLSKPTSRSTK